MQVNFQNVEYTMRKEEDELFYNGTLMVAYSSEYPYVTEGRARVFGGSISDCRPKAAL